MTTVANIIAVAIFVSLIVPSHALPNPCQYCAFCPHCEKCDQCPCTHVKECSLCKYCSYCSLCSMCSTFCGEGSIIDSASSLVNRVVQFLGLEAAPDFREVNNDIAGLSPRFTKDFEAQKRQLGKRLKAQKNEKAPAKEEL